MFRVLCKSRLNFSAIVKLFAAYALKVKFYRFDTLFCHSKKSALVDENVAKDGNYSPVSQ